MGLKVQRTRGTYERAWWKEEGRGGMESEIGEERRGEERGCGGRAASSRARA